MIKLRLILIIAIVSNACVCTYGQNSKSANSQLEKLLKEAVGSKSATDGVFTIRNTKKKVITLKEARNFLKQRGFLTCNGISQDVNRFGDYVTVLKEITFINPKDYDAYIFSQLTNSAYESLNSLQARGCFFVPVHKDLYRPISSVGIIKVRTGSMEELQRLDNVRWSGNVVDGFLDGQGTGFIVDEKGEYSVIKGSFNRGLPTNSITIHKAVKDLNGDKLYAKPTVKTYNAITLEILSQNAGTKDALLQKALQYAKNSYYQQATDRLEQVYQKMRGITIDNYSNFVIDNYLEVFWTSYNNTNYDPRNMMPKASEMVDVCNVIRGLNCKIRDEYYGYNLWSLLTMNYEWFNKFVEADDEVLSESLATAARRKDNSTYGFKNFFKEAYTRLEKKYTDFNNKVDTDYKEYSKKFDAVAAKHAKIRGQLSHEIDWDNYKEPSGDLVSIGLLTSYTTYENDGVIRAKAGGDYCYYNVVFNGNKEIDHYRVNSASTKIENYLNGKRTFKSREELVEHIVNAIR